MEDLFMKAAKNLLNINNIEIISNLSSLCLFIGLDKSMTFLIVTFFMFSKHLLIMTKNIFTYLNDIRSGVEPTPGKDLIKVKAIHRCSRICSKDLRMKKSVSEFYIKY